LEWNRLESAEDFASQAVEISNGFGEEELRVESAILLALVWHAQGRIDEAHSSLLALKTQCKQPRFLHHVEAAQVRLALASGDSATLRRWQRGPENLPLPRLQRQTEALLSARVELARGHALEAMTILSEWQRSIGEDGHSRVEMLVISALAAHAQNNLTEARQALCEAVELAHFQGYQRVFLDAGDGIADLLRTLLRELKVDAVVAYVRSLLLTFAAERSTAQPATQLPPVDEAVLVEPLSGQERRILRLLAADLSYPEIAEELVISLNTVKTHVKNVYGKLGVHSRTEASEVAHQLQLL
jgi:LuxR family maltose regulon positive regulatory protein